LKRNLKNYWWRVMVHERDDVVGMDGSILMNRAVWKASGHEDTFIDPMVECFITKKRFRADQIEPQSGTVYRWGGARESDEAARADIGIALEVLSDHFAVLLTPGKPPESARKLAVQFYQQRGLKNPILLDETSEKVENTRAFNPENGAMLSEPRQFNLMLETYLGATRDESSKTYLRPETAQSIFVQFKNVLEVSRKKLPFGIAQIGKAFRNEINPRNFTFRSREFEQMELEYFCRAEQGMELLEYWKEERLKFYENIGIPREKLHVKTVSDEERAFYSKGTYDIEYEFPFGVQELEGVAYRTDYDLSQHQKASGKSLEYFDEETKQKFIPHVVEPSAGVDRTVLALICEAYSEDQAPDEKGKME
jgi:glycyl-tRNA synthetase